MKSKKAISTKEHEGAGLYLDDAFNPSELSFKEGDTEITFFNLKTDTRESLQLGVKKKGEYVVRMRLPLYARFAIAQMMTNTLNGMSLQEEMERLK